MGFGLGVGVAITSLLTLFILIVDVFVGVTVNGGVGVEVPETSSVIAGEIFELSVAAIVGSKVTMGVELIFTDSFSPIEVLDFVPKKYEIAPTKTRATNSAIIIKTLFFTKRTLLLIS